MNGIAGELEKRAASLVGGTIEAVAAFRHPYGCSQLGEDQENTRKILADIVNHPNAGGVLVLGLGCENSGIEILKAQEFCQVCDEQLLPLTLTEAHAHPRRLSS